jgi:hypothetical protein
MGASVLRLFFHDCFVNVRFGLFGHQCNARPVLGSTVS